MLKNMTEKNISDDKKRDNPDESECTPWVVKGKIDYSLLVKNFGTELIDDNLISRFEEVIKRPVHPWIKRGLFFSHRELHRLLNAYEAGEPMFLYTGRGPTSDAMHIGHLVPFIFTKWLQDVFDCPLVIQISDDEKYYFKPLEFLDVYRLGFKNAEDIIACGFNPKKTFIFSNRDYRLAVPEYEVFVSDMKKLVSIHTIKKVFGFGKEKFLKQEEINKGMKPEVDFENIGMYDWPIYQTAAAFSCAFPHIFPSKSVPAHCLVAYAIDQDPYFRLARDIADKMELIKPYSIMSMFIPPLVGSEGKMSSSIGTDSTIFLTDNEETIQNKVMKYAFSGSRGDGTLADHRRLGGDIDKDISYQYLRYFELNDDKLEHIRTEFESGRMTCSEIKKIMAQKLIDVIGEHQKRKTTITPECVADFYVRKPM